MATKFSFIFQSGTAGWSETYYKNVSPTPSLVTSLPEGFWRGFFTPRGISTVCKSVRLSDAEVPRAGTLVRVNMRRSSVGLSTTNVDDDPPSMAAELDAAAVGARRKLTVRGLRDYSYTRDSSGLYTPDATVRSHFVSFADAVVAAGFTIRHLAPVGLSIISQVVVSLSAGDGEGKTTMAVPIVNTGLWHVGNIVQFGGLPSGIFPGLRGPVPIVRVTTEGNLILPVRWTGPTATVATPRATVRLVSYTYHQITGATIADIREHRTGRPSDLSRGRRSGTAYRSR